MTRAAVPPDAPLLVGHDVGTQRLQSPERTLAQITPLLPTLGITRCLDITGLDCIGIPVFCAVRPHSTLLQISSGKGVSAAHARCSALMESIELYHAENLEPAKITEWASEQSQLAARAPTAVMRHADSRCFDPAAFQPTLRLPWIDATDLVSGDVVTLPASVAYFNQPGFHLTSTNGLASGNHPIEAALHAFYELIERDAISLLGDGNGLLDLRGRVAVIRPETIRDAPLADLIEAIHVSGSELVLMAVPSRIAVHTFWAVLIDPQAQTAVASLTMGYGTHVDPVIAACRAVTEAAQSRLIFIHGGREDICEKIASQSAGGKAGSRVQRYFRRLPANVDWSAQVEHVAAPSAMCDLRGMHDWVVDALAASGCNRLYCHDLTRPEIGIAVVKVIAPTLRFNHKLF